ncbi:MAG: hypothetical protein HY360_17370 [Verrucomicrobia bacterium]|nr:hypothetical protein [Verrucomicrobiota bacterium]
MKLSKIKSRRIRRIYILHHTHVDLGYTAERNDVYRDQVEMVGQAMELVERGRKRPSVERFRWIHEVSWPVLEYLRRKGKPPRRFFEQMRDGLVELTGFYLNPTDLFDEESFRRSLDYACRLARRHKIPLTTAMFSDCPGIAWSVVDLMAERGLRYLSSAPNFVMSRPLEIERPFWWEGPRGGRVLTWFSDWRYSWYAEGLILKLTGDPANATSALLDYVSRLEREGYRWKGLAIHLAMDNQPPALQLCEFVRHFNSHQAGIEAQLAINRDFFSYMEREHGREFPVHRGAWPDWWANGHASAAFETACSRRAKSVLRRCWGLRDRLKKNIGNELEDGAWENLLLFDEHTWGAAGSVSAPWSLESRQQWAEKRSLAMRGLHGAKRLEAALLKDVCPKKGVTIINPFQSKFHGVVEFTGNNISWTDLALRDSRTGQDIPLQPTDGGGGCAVVEIPSGGEMPFEAVRTGSHRSSHHKSQALFIENDRFEVTWNRKTGAVTRVVDKETGNSIIDRTAPWSFAEIVHERLKGGNRQAMYDPSRYLKPQAKRPRPEFIRRGGHAVPVPWRVVHGPVFQAFRTSGDLPGVTFHREIRLYQRLPRMDIRLRLEKQVVTDYESLYLAFPLAGKRPEVWLENAGTIYRAGTDQLPGSATDWHQVGDYVAVNNRDQTLLLVSQEVPLVQVGDIHTGKWARRLRVDNGHLYSWVMNNMWFTNFPAYQEGTVEMTWALTVQRGAFNAQAAAEFARQIRDGVSVTCAPSAFVI